jgi:hypothetical protein
MRFSNFSRLFTAVAFAWLLTISAAAQEDTGGGFGSYTSIDYNPDTNIVTAYSQTEPDYILMGDYQARVSLTVTNDYGVIVASGSGYDNGEGFASVSLSFVAEPDRTYTAIGTHRAFTYFWDYEEEYWDYPYYRQARTYYYFDNWYFTSFEGGGIYQPWYYSFYRPSYSYFRRRTATINLGRTYDWVSTTVSGPKITINVPATAQDGDTVTFSVTTQNGTPTTYEWSFEAPSSAGNNPQVNFTSPTSDSTTAKAHWFAYPNRACPPTSAISEYKIKVKVTFSDGTQRTERKSFKVTVVETGGQVSASNSLAGGPVTDQDPNTGIFFVDNIGSLHRVRTVTKTIFVPTTSQFFSKVDTHENVHLSQWADNGLFGVHFDPRDFYNRIKGFTDTTRDGLNAQIVGEYDRFLTDEAALVKGKCNQGEIEAYTVSDPLSPQYIYQRCGRTTFSNCQ